MIIDLNELRLRHEPLSLDVDFDDQQLKLPSDVSLLRPPVRSQLSISWAGDQVKVEGNLEADLELTCCRCLRFFDQSLKKDFRLEYWPDPAVTREGEEVALNYQDLVVGFYRSDQLDLKAVVYEQIVLEISMKPICSESCKGLCDQCGANLNESECSCESQPIDPRLAVLSKIKERLNN